MQPNLTRLAEAFDPTAMDALLLLAPTTGSIGYAGRGDFAFAADGRLRRRAEREVAPFVYAGAAILAPALFAGAPKGEFPLTDLFDRAADAGRLHGLRLEGLWMHVGTPDAIVPGGKGDPRQHGVAPRQSVYDSRDAGRQTPTSSTSPPRRRFCRC